MNSASPATADATVRELTAQAQELYQRPLSEVEAQLGQTQKTLGRPQQSWLCYRKAGSDYLLSYDSAGRVDSVLICQGAGDKVLCAAWPRLDERRRYQLLRRQKRTKEAPAPYLMLARSQSAMR